VAGPGDEVPWQVGSVDLTAEVTIDLVALWEQATEVISGWPERGTRIRSDYWVG